MIQKTLSIAAWVLIFVTLINPAFAADQGDLYIEAKVGSHLEVTTELMSGAQLGYVVSDGFGVGFMAEQVFATTNQSAGRNGFLFGPEVRWFLEPLEFSGSAGVASLAAGSEVYLIGSGTYLFSLTPALALASDIRVRYTPQTKTEFYFLLGLRTLF